MDIGCHLPTTHFETIEISLRFNLRTRSSPEARNP